VYTRNHTRPCREPCPRLHREPLRSHCCIFGQGHAYASIPGGCQLHVFAVSCHVMARATCLFHLQEGALPTPPLKESRGRVYPSLHRPSLAAASRLPVVASIRGGHTTSLFLEGAMPAPPQATMSCCRALLACYIPEDGHARISFPGGGAASTPVGAMVTLLHTPLTAGASLPSVLAIPTPLLLKGAMPEP